MQTAGTLDAAALAEPAEGQRRAAVPDAGAADRRAEPRHREVGRRAQLVPAPRRAAAPIAAARRSSIPTESRMTTTATTARADGGTVTGGRVRAAAPAGGALAGAAPFFVYTADLPRPADVGAALRGRPPHRPGHPHHVVHAREHHHVVAGLLPHRDVGQREAVPDHRRHLGRRRHHRRLRDRHVAGPRPEADRAAAVAACSRTSAASRSRSASSPPSAPPARSINLIHQVCAELRAGHVHRRRRWSTRTS